MYADNGMPCSNSRPGLSRCLNTLEECCKSWCIKVNLTKTKWPFLTKAVKWLKETFKIMVNQLMIILENINI